MHEFSQSVTGSADMRVKIPDPEQKIVKKRDIRHYLRWAKKKVPRKAAFETLAPDASTALCSCFHPEPSTYPVSTSCHFDCCCMRQL